MGEDDGEIYNMKNISRGVRIRRSCRSFGTFLWSGMARGRPMKLLRQLAVILLLEILVCICLSDKLANL